MLAQNSPNRCANSTTEGQRNEYAFTIHPICEIWHCENKGKCVCSKVSVGVIQSVSIQKPYSLTYCVALTISQLLLSSMWERFLGCCVGSVMASPLWANWPGRPGMNPWPMPPKPCTPGPWLWPCPCPPWLWHPSLIWPCGCTRCNLLETASKHTSSQVYWFQQLYATKYSRPWHVSILLYTIKWYHYLYCQYLSL